VPLPGGGARQVDAQVAEHALGKAGAVQPVPAIAAQRVTHAQEAGGGGPHVSAASGAGGGGGVADGRVDGGPADVQLLPHLNGAAVQTIEAHQRAGVRPRGARDGGQGVTALDGVRGGQGSGAGQGGENEGE